MEFYQNSSSNASTPSSINIALCYNVEVHITGNTLAAVISDTVCCFIDLFTMIISFCSNALVISVYLKLPSGRSTANLLLASLSFTELIKSVLVQPAFFIWKIMELSKLDFCSPYLFTAIGTNFCTLSSFLHTCFLISVERYLSVYKPIQHRKPIVQQSFIVAAILTQLTGAALLLSLFFTFHHRTYFISMCLVIVVGFSGTTVMYVMIRAKMRKSSIARNTKDTAQCTSKHATDRRMNKTVITIILVSLACYLPLFCVLVILSVHERTVWHTRFMIPWVYLVTFLTAAVNPFVYCWKNRRLRSEIVKFTKRFFLSNQRTSENSSSITSSGPISNTTKV